MLDSNDRKAGARPGKPSRREAIYRQLKDELVNCQVRPGQHLSIAEISASFRSSNTPVREALTRLCAQHLVSNGPAGGFVARELGLKEMRELLDLARVLLPSCITNAIHRSDRSGIAIPTALELQSRYCASRVLRAWPEETAAFIENIFRNVAEMSGNREIVENICERTLHVRVRHVKEMCPGRAFPDQLIALLSDLERDERAAAVLRIDQGLRRQIEGLPELLTKALTAMFMDKQTAK